MTWVTVAEVLFILGEIGLPKKCFISHKDAEARKRLCRASQECLPVEVCCQRGCPLQAGVH